MRSMFRFAAFAVVTQERTMAPDDREMQKKGWLAEVPETFDARTRAYFC